MQIFQEKIAGSYLFHMKWPIHDHVGQWCAEASRSIQLRQPDRGDQEVQEMVSRTRESNLINKALKSFLIISEQFERFEVRTLIRDSAVQMLLNSLIFYCITPSATKSHFRTA